MARGHKTKIVSGHKKGHMKKRRKGRGRKSKGLKR